LTKRAFNCINNYGCNHQQVRPTKAQGQVFIELSSEERIFSQKNLAGIEGKRRQKEKNQDLLRIVP
jgi:hypothetical protein